MIENSLEPDSAIKSAQNHCPDVTYGQTSDLITTDIGNNGLILSNTLI